MHYAMCEVSLQRHRRTDIQHIPDRYIAAHEYGDFVLLGGSPFRSHQQTDETSSQQTCFAEHCCDLCGWMLSATFVQP